MRLTLERGSCYSSSLGMVGFAPKRTITYTEGWPRAPFCSMRRWFFFSSRRRHTRLQGDWSSDVCSSDLGSWSAHISGAAREDPPEVRSDSRLAGAKPFHDPCREPVVAFDPRSEERRVGKECRFGRATWQHRKNIKMRHSGVMERIKECYA